MRSFAVLCKCMRMYMLRVLSPLNKEPWNLASLFLNWFVRLLYLSIEYKRLLKITISMYTVMLFYSNPECTTIKKMRQERKKERKKGRSPIQDWGQLKRIIFVRITSECSLWTTYILRVIAQYFLHGNKVLTSSKIGVMEIVIFSFMSLMFMIV